VLGAEQVRWVKRLLAGVNLSEETLALEVIDEVGPGRQFLDHAHTIKHLRTTTWQPYVTDRDGFDAWVAGGSKEYGERAREHARRLLHSHQPAPLAAEVDATLQRLCGLASDG
jgi:trimethylamine---corrinoid protein Co-methyltransferase